MNRKFNYDVIVSGGGLAGVAAAVSAAKEGANVLLIERYGFLGGAATNALVNPFMDYVMATGEMVNSGIFGEILKRLDEVGGLYKGNKATFNEEFLKVILDNLCNEVGVDVLLHSFVAQVKTEDKKIKKLTVATKSGLLSFEAKYFVDATGDADLAFYAGVKTEIGNENGYCQPMSLNFRIANVDRRKFAPMFAEKIGGVLYGVDNKEITRKVIEKYREKQKSGEIKNPREDVQTFPCMMDSMIHFNSTRVLMKLGCDVFELSDAERIAREQMIELYDFMKNNVEGFENSELLMSASQIGVRETRRIIGRYVLTADDLLSCIHFDDSIARGIYCIDIHNPEGTGTTIKEIPNGKYYTIPYRSLLSMEIENLAVCGRPISASHEAHSAIRVMPIATCTGQAAGIAVGIAAKEGSKLNEVAISKIQSKLKRYNALY